MHASEADTSMDIEPSDVRRRLPTVTLIDDDGIQSRTESAIADGVLEYFWTAPAASSYKYHHPFCCDERGLWIHTLMVATAYEELVPTYLVDGRLSEYEADLGRSAVLLHDLRKYGMRYQPGAQADTDHDIQMARFIRSETELDDRVSDAVATHMGPFDRYEGPAPVTPLQDLVHLADMAGSTKNGTWGIFDPPAELVEQYPALAQADL